MHGLGWLCPNWPLLRLQSWVLLSPLQERWSCCRLCCCFSFPALALSPGEADAGGGWGWGASLRVLTDLACCALSLAQGSKPLTCPAC